MATHGGIAEGYLVLSDISGYTAFLTESELEHAQSIIEDLTSTMLASLSPVLALVKVEGDAAFCYAPASSLSSAEQLLALLESCYCDFLDRLEAMERNTTCTCTACANIGTLDLKFVAHRGEYAVRQVAGALDLAGPDVILAHRLLKNSIRETTGIAAYAFLSRQCDDLPEAVSGAVPHEETYPSLGTVQGRVFDMKRAARRLREDRRVFVEHNDADGEVVYAIDVPAPAAWAVIADASLTPLWSKAMQSQVDVPNAEGRVGAGSERHCDHGSWASSARVLDWKPPYYFSQHRRATRGGWSAPPPMFETWLVEPREGGGSTVTFRFRMDRPGRLMRMLARLMWPVERRRMQKDEAALNELALTRYGTEEDDAAR